MVVFAIAALVASPWYPVMFIVNIVILCLAWRLMNRTDDSAVKALALSALVVTVLSLLLSLVGVLWWGNFEA